MSVSGVHARFAGGVRVLGVPPGLGGDRGPTCSGVCGCENVDAAPDVRVWASADGIGDGGTVDSVDRRFSLLSGAVAVSLLSCCCSGSGRFWIWTGRLIVYFCRAFLFGVSLAALATLAVRPVVGHITASQAQPGGLNHVGLRKTAKARENGLVHGDAKPRGHAIGSWCQDVA